MLDLAAAVLLANLCMPDPSHPLALLTSPIHPPQLVADKTLLFNSQRSFEVLYRTSRGRDYRVVIQAPIRADGTVDFFTPMSLPGCQQVG